MKYSRRKSAEVHCGGRRVRRQNNIPAQHYSAYNTRVVCANQKAVTKKKKVPLRNGRATRTSIILLLLCMPSLRYLKKYNDIDVHIGVENNIYYNNIIYHKQPEPAKRLIIKQSHCSFVVLGGGGGVSL